MAEETLFSTGRILVTSSAAQALRDAGTPVSALLGRHRRGDWGDVPSDARLANDRALLAGGELGSTYRLSTGNECSVVTDEARALTVVMTDADLPVFAGAPPEEVEQRMRAAAGAAIVLNVDEQEGGGQEGQVLPYSSWQRIVSDGPV